MANINTLHADMPLFTHDGKRAVIVDRREHEKLWMRQEWCAVREAERMLRARRRELRQLKDRHEMESV
jgi:hypothetical protein